MSCCKLSCFVLLFLASFIIVNSTRVTTFRPPPAPMVSIVSTNMSPSMQLDASDFMKRVLTLNDPKDRVRVFNELLTEKYPGFLWHVVRSDTVFVKGIKVIDLKAGNERYLAFYTKK